LYSKPDKVKMRLDLKAVSVTAAAALCLLLISRAFMLAIESEESRVRRSVYKAKRYAEKEDLAGLNGSISADYRDELGNDRRSLLFIAKTFFQECDRILIHIDSIKISIENGNASADTGTTVYWQETGSEKITYDSARVNASFRKESGAWKLIELRFYEEDKKRHFNPMIG